MTGSLTYQTPTPAPAPEQGRRSPWRVLVDLFEKNPLANGLLIGALVIGFFHGWLKIHYRSPLTTFAFDIPIMAAMAVVFISRGREPVFPNTPMSIALRSLVNVTGVWLVLSIVIWDVPVFAGLAAFRGWCLIPLVFLLGAHLATSIRQVEFYIWLVIVLGFVTALYGIFFQTEADVRRMMELDPELNFRFQNQFYHTAGGAQFRRFSTYVSSAAFSSQMAFSIMFSFSRITVKECPWLERLALTLMAGVMSYAMMLTGSRSSLLQLLMALVFTAWYRRGGIAFVIVPAVMFVAWKLGVKATEGEAVNRYATLLEGKTLWWRLWIVLQPSWTAFLEAPLGTGLGSSSHGVPMFLVGKMAGKIRGIDGDFGHLVVDMGIVGVLFFGNVLFQGCRESWRWMTKLRDTPLSVVSLPAGIFFLQSCAAFSFGSPFLGIPFGPLVWLFFGALSRLCLDYDTMIASGNAHSTAFQEKFASFIGKQRVRLLFTDKGQSAAASVSVPRIGGPRGGNAGVALLPGRARRFEATASGARPAPARKRFLYYRPPEGRE